MTNESGKWGKMDEKAEVRSSKFTASIKKLFIKAYLLKQQKRSPEKASVYERNVSTLCPESGLTRFFFFVGVKYAGRLCG